VSNTEIEKWCQARSEFSALRDKVIESGIAKLERNAFAQTLLGLTSPVEKYSTNSPEN
jgi:hypothetical protein